MAEQSAEGKIRFAGPALAEGTMDVRDFAPALVGLADLVEASAHTLYGDDIRSRVFLSSGFRRGSFIADFQIYLDGALQFSAFAAGVHAMGATELLKAIGIHASATYNLLRLVKFLRGRQPEEKVALENGKVEIHVEGSNNNIVVVPPEVVSLYESDGVKRALYGMSRPLEKEGVTEVQFRQGRRVAERIKRRELPYLEAAAKELRLTPTPVQEPEPVSETEEVLTVDLLQGVFSEQESFRFYDGENKFYARITDESWWQRIHDGGDGYFDGDRMKVRRVSRQVVDRQGRLHREHEIVHVLDHQHRPRQGELFD